MQLCDVLKQWRWAERLSVREAAKVIGVSSSTLNRFENGKPADQETIVRIMLWLFDGQRREK